MVADGRLDEGIACLRGLESANVRPCCYRLLLPVDNTSSSDGSGCNARWDDRSGLTSLYEDGHGEGEDQDPEVTPRLMAAVSVIPQCGSNGSRL